MRIQITKYMGNYKLTREIFTFYFSSNIGGHCGFALDDYIMEYKKNVNTKKWEIISQYNRILTRNNNVELETFLTDEIVKEGKEAVMKEIAKKMVFVKD